MGKKEKMEKQDHVKKEPEIQKPPVFDYSKPLDEWPEEFRKIESLPADLYRDFEEQFKKKLNSKLSGDSFFEALKKREKEIQENIDRIANIIKTQRVHKIVVKDDIGQDIRVRTCRFWDKKAIEVSGARTGSKGEVICDKITELENELRSIEMTLVKISVTKPDWTTEPYYPLNVIGERSFSADIVFNQAGPDEAPTKQIVPYFALKAFMQSGGCSWTSTEEKTKTSGGTKKKFVPKLFQVYVSQPSDEDIQQYNQRY